MEAKKNVVEDNQNDVKNNVNNYIKGIVEFEEIASEVDKDNVSQYATNKSMSLRKLRKLMKNE